jgi:hypothetical protein
MNVNSGPQRFVQAFLTSAIHYFFYGKVICLWVFAMKKGCSYPDFISDFQLQLGRDSHVGLQTSH